MHNEEIFLEMSIESWNSNEKRPSSSSVSNYHKIIIKAIYVKKSNLA